MTTAVPGPLLEHEQFNAPCAPVALQRGHDAGLMSPHTPARLQDRETREHPREDEQARRRKRLLFPALTTPLDGSSSSTRDPSLAAQSRALVASSLSSRPPPLGLPFDPCVSPLVARFSARTRVDEAARQTAAEAIRFLLSQECQRSLPAAWWSSNDDDMIARESMDWAADLPIQSLIRSKYLKTPTPYGYMREGKYTYPLAGTQAPLSRAVHLSLSYPPPLASQIFNSFFLSTGCFEEPLG